MSGKALINSNQLLSMIILFEFGTALVIPIGLSANQGIWLSILLALPAGIFTYIIFDYLQRQYPNMILSGYMRSILGRYISLPISMLYIAYFMYVASRNLREVGDLLITSSYDQTPILVIHAAMIIAVIYVLHKGIEVFFRLGQIYLIIMISLGLIGNVFILASGEIELRNLLPLTGDGWKSVLEAAFPHIYMFPFAEIVCFSTVLSRLNNVSKARSAGIIALVLSGMGLSLTHALEISVLGANMYSRSTFPLFTTISLVEIADFLQRLDAIVILTLIIGVFFKMSMYTYGAMAIAADIFGIDDESKLAYPIGITVLCMSILMAASFPEHNEEGLINIRVNSPIFSLMIPLLLLLVHFIRQRARSNMT